MALHSIQFDHALSMAEALPTELISEQAKGELVARIARARELSLQVPRGRAEPRWYQSRARVADRARRERNRISAETHAATRRAYDQLNALKDPLPTDTAVARSQREQLTAIFLQLTKAISSFSGDVHRLY